MGKQLDGRSDIYAMGVLAFELITGHLPFPDANGPAELIGAQLKKSPPLPSAAMLLGEIPQTVDAIILKMLEKDRGRRSRAGDELAADITPCLATAGRSTGPIAALSLASGVSMAPQAPDSVSLPPPAASPGARPYTLAPPTEAKEVPAPSQSRLVLWLIVAVVVLAGAPAGGALLRPRECRPAGP